MPLCDKGLITISVDW